MTPLACPNKNSPEWKALVEALGENYAYKVFLANDERVPEMRAVRAIVANTKSNEVNYEFKAAKILIDNIERILKLRNSIKDDDAFWNKVQKDFQIPKDQLQLFRDSEGDTLQNKLASFLANYSYTVEINTATEGGNIGINKGKAISEARAAGLKYGTEEFEDFVKNYLESKREVYIKKPTQHYSNLTVQGGINYTENEIATPEIIPSIKGHAQFATEKGIGWFRSDDRKYTEEIELPELENDEDETSIKLVKSYPEIDGPKTRRILEVQSDLFQKGRDKVSLIKEGEKRTVGNYTIEGTFTGRYGVRFKNSERYVAPIFDKLEDAYEFVYKKSTENQFLQLLNKDNNWVTFFVKSIIQDSAKKGYEKVLFPTGNTASKVEGHTTLEEFKREKENRIKELKEDIKNINVLLDKKVDAIGNPFEEGQQQGYENKIIQKNNEINQLKQELERVEREGFAALKPIYKFYEETVNNILNKQGYNPTKITDEYGNTWYEVTLEAKNKSTILFNLQSFHKTARLYGMNDKGFFPANSNIAELKKLGERYGYTLSKASNESYYFTNAHGLKYTPPAVNYALESTQKVNQKLNDFLIKFLGDLGIKVELVENLLATDTDGVTAIALANITKKLIQISKTGAGAIPEEAGHMIIEMLADKSFVSQLISAAKKDPLYESVKEEYGEVYNNDEMMLAKETAGKLLAIEMNIQFNRSEETAPSLNSPGLVRRLLNRVIALIKKLFGSAPSIEEELDSVFGILAKKILAGDKTGISIKNIIEDSKASEIKLYSLTPQETALEALEALKVIERIDYEEDGMPMHRYEYMGIQLESTTAKSVVKPFELEGAKEHIIELTEFSRAVGTRFHQLAEEVVKTFDDDNFDIDYFISTYSDFAEPEVIEKAVSYIKKNILEPARKQDPGCIFITENIIGNIKHRLGGTTDLLVVWSDGSVSIYDWKTSYRSDLNKDYKRLKLPTYERQQNIYRTILSTPQPEIGFPGLNIRAVYLVPFQLNGNKKKKKVRFITTRIPKAVQSRAQKDFIEDLFGVKDRSAQGKLDDIVNKVLTKIERRIEVLEKRGKFKDSMELNRYAQLLRTLGNMEVLQKEFDRYLEGLTKYLDSSNKVIKADITDNELLEMFTLLSSLEGMEDAIIGAAGSREALPETLYNTIMRVQHNRVVFQNQITDLMNSRAQAALEKLSSNPNLAADIFHNTFDLDMLSRWFNSAGDSSNPIIALADRFLKKIEFDVNEAYKPAHKELMELMSELIEEVGERDPKKLFDFMLIKNKDGEVIPYFVNKFSYAFWEKLREMQQATYDAVTDAEKEAALEALAEWKRNNFQQKYTDEYYEVFKLLDPLKDIDGVNYKAILDSKRQDLNDLQEKYKSGEEWTEEDILLKKSLEDDIEDFKIYGAPPVVAKILKKFHTEYRKRHIYKADPKFEEINKAKKATLSTEEYQKWYNDQFEDAFGEEYWEWVNGLTARAEKAIDQIIKNLPLHREYLESVKSSLEVAKMIRNKIFKDYKDTNGEVNGLLVTPEDLDKLLEAESNIREAKNRIKELAGKHNDFSRAMEEFATRSSFDTTHYYDDFIALLKHKYGEATYRDSEEYKKHHYFSDYEDRWLPISIWTKVNSLEFVRERKLKSNWMLKEVKEAYINKTYTEDRYGHALPREKEEWLDKRYTDLMSLPDTSAKKKFYLLFTGLMEETNGRIPTKRSIHAIPNVSGATRFNAKDYTSLKKIGANLKGNYTVSKEDQANSAKEMLDEADHLVQFFPTRFFSNPDPGTVSYNLADTILAYYKAGLTYEKRAVEEPTVKFILESVVKAKVQRKSASGIPTLDKVASRIQGREVNQTIDGDKSFIYERLHDLFNMNYYETGDPQFYISSVSINKIADTIMRYNSLLYMSFNFFAGTANIALGEVMQIQEAVGGQFYDRKDYQRATAAYGKGIAGAMEDVMSGRRSSFLSLILDYFDTLQDQDEYGKKPSKANQLIYKRLMSTDVLFFLNHGGEHKIQTTLLLAMMSSHTVENGKLVRITNREKQRSILDSVKVKNGEIEIEGLAITHDLKFQFQQKVIALSQRLHGVYTMQDRAAIQKYWVAQLAFQFRKWVLPGFRTRFQKEYHNERLQDTVEGYYRTLFKFLFRAAKDIKSTAELYQTLKPHEIANLKKATYEVVMYTFLIILGALIAAMRDDDEERKDSRLWNFALYSVDRLATEYRFFTNYSDMMKVLRSPSASISSVSGIMEAINQTILFDITEWPPHHNSLERYKSGSRKGELKFLHELEQAIPILGIIDRFVNLEDQVNYYRK